MDKEKRAAEKRAARSHKEDAILNRVLIWFGAAVVVELVLLLLNRYYINITTAPGEIEFAGALLKAWPVIIGVAAAGTVVCLLWAIFWAKGGKRIVLPAALTGVFLAVLVISVVTYRFYDTGVQFLCGAVPAAAVLALVYYLYQHEFLPSRSSPPWASWGCGSSAGPAAGTRSWCTPMRPSWRWCCWPPSSSAAPCRPRAASSPSAAKSSRSSPRTPPTA